MRYAAMQVLTWGTIAGVISSALLLAALDRPQLHYPVELPDATSLLGEPTPAGRVQPKSAVKEAPLAGSTPQVANR
jgi:hypothetical protein